MWNKFENFYYVINLKIKQTCLIIMIIMLILRLTNKRRNKYEKKIENILKIMFEKNFQGILIRTPDVFDQN